MSQNKHIHLQYCCLTYISNARIIRASRLTNGIDLNNKNKQYVPIEVFIESDESNMSDLSEFKESSNNLTPSHTTTALVCRTRVEDTLNKLCKPCIRSKSSQVIKHNKDMTVITEKLKKIYVDFWGSHNPPSLSKSTYTAILICKHIRKTWTLYLKEKDKFVDVFQAWLPRIKIESTYSMKIFQADRVKKFISAKL